MALNKNTLKNQLEIGLKQIFASPATTNNKDAIAEQMAVLISDKVDNYIKQATIVYTSGLIAPTSGGAVSGTFQGNLQ